MSTQTLVQPSVSEQLKDVRLDITWSNIARRYFGNSASWLYNKMNESGKNAEESKFTYSEKMQLRNALYDFADRIKKAADAIV